MTKFFSVYTARTADTSRRLPLPRRQANARAGGITRPPGGRRRGGRSRPSPRGASPRTVRTGGVDEVAGEDERQRLAVLLGAGRMTLTPASRSASTIRAKRSGGHSRSTSTGMCPRGVRLPRSWKMERRFPPFVAMGLSDRSSSPGSSTSSSRTVYAVPRRSSRSSSAHLLSIACSLSKSRAGTHIRLRSIGLRAIPAAVNDHSWYASPRGDPRGRESRTSPRTSPQASAPAAVDETATPDERRRAGDVAAARRSTI